MPFLFERIDDETELLLPSNLLATDSLIQKLVKEIDEEDWKKVEILGWLYQFYISERKDEVIGKVVASEDIPAATQLFTPNWIVKYLVQNTLGRIWLATYPQSAIRQQMEFYIEPAEQTPEVQEQLKAITPTSLNPEELTLLDPACGSAHILVEAYDLFKAIYQERGYRAKDIPGLILSKNLFGLEIDDRAAQLAAFALLMKARADDRRILESGVQPAILSFVESKGMDAEAITHALNSPIKDEKAPPSEFLRKELEDAEMPLLAKKRSSADQPHAAKADIATLLEFFENGKTFGSLIQIPAGLAEKLPALEERLAAVLKDGDLTHAQSGVIAPLLRQARLLARQYDAVVANPPYMGRRAFVPLLRKFAASEYNSCQADLCGMFMLRAITLCKAGGYMGLITLPSWMFLSAFEQLRNVATESLTVDSLLHLGRGIFGIDWGSSAFSTRRMPLPGFVGRFFKLHRKVFQHIRAEDIATLTRRAMADPDFRFDFSSYRDEDGVAPIPMHSDPVGDQLHYQGRIGDFMKIPGRPIAYWLPKQIYTAFATRSSFDTLARPRVGMQTANNDLFLRFWWEVDWAKTSLASAGNAVWVAYLKGGEYRKWWGNGEHVLRNEGDGALLRTQKNATLPDPSTYQCSRCNWSDIGASKPFAARRAPPHSYFDIAAHAFFPRQHGDGVLAFANSSFFNTCIGVLNPGLHFQVGDAKRVPAPSVEALTKAGVSEEVCVRISQADWCMIETAWDFVVPPLLKREDSVRGGMRESYAELREQWSQATSRLKQAEADINDVFVKDFGVDGIVAIDPSVEEVSLLCNPAYRYGTPYGSEEGEKRLVSDVIKEMKSYAIGCMMGRYSLDKEGLIYAHSGNHGFGPNQYTKFPADDDGIVPVTEAAWFDDDAANRFERFVKTVWPTETLEENIAFVAESLGAKKSETPRETIRRYFAGDFYKHHLQTYKNRPIYWLFSSGKQGAFEALVYLHRYNEGTLSRMRTEYVVPLLGKMNGRLGMLADTIAKAPSTKQRKDAEKEKDKLAKQLAELQAFDDKLRHYADQRITLDLDDGVRVNYGKFGDLLADVKKVCGKAEEE
jgi:hypothetical protein